MSTNLIGPSLDDWLGTYKAFKAPLWRSGNYRDEEAIQQRAAYLICNHIKLTNESFDIGSWNAEMSDHKGSGTRLYSVS